MLRNTIFLRNASTSTSQLKSKLSKPIVLVEGVRTPFLKSFTDFKSMWPHDLQREALVGLARKTGIDKGKDIDSMCLGTVIQEVKTSNMAREAALGAGYSLKTSASTVTMACISSNQALANCVASITNGTSNACVAGGVDTMSDVPIRFSRKMRSLLLKLTFTKGTSKKIPLILSMLNPAMWPPEIPGIAEFSTNEIMGHSADRLCAAFGVSRTESDAFALKSHAGAASAFKEGRLWDIVPVKVPGMSKAFINQDNGVREATMADLGKLKPAFVRPHGTVTAANSSFLTDGASACLVASEEHALAKGWRPKAFIRDFHFVSQDPVDQMLLGPAHAIPGLLKRNGLTLKDIDVIELHEAFAGQVLANVKALDCEYFCREHLGLAEGRLGAMDMNRVNKNGGSVSLGHPFAATGVRLVTSAANRLIQENGRIALVAACAAGGQGHAMLIERY